MTAPRTGDDVERTLVELGQRIVAKRRRGSAFPDDFPAFRAAIEERLRGIERELAETKQRINALLMVAVGAVVSAVAVRLAELLA